MGGAASKGARQLPKNIPSAPRSAPEWAKTNLPSDPPPSSNTTFRRAPAPEPTSSSAGSARHGRLETGSGVGNEPRGQPIGRSTTNFSGDKDDVVKRDALDPHFAANLSRLGPVKINDAGKFIPTLASEQRTLNARQVNEEATSSDIPPPGHLNAQLLSQLLDDLKSVKSADDVDGLYAHYGMSPEQMKPLRRWINSPSVGEVSTLQVDNREVTELNAVWVEKNV